MQSTAAAANSQWVFQTLVDVNLSIRIYSKAAGRGAIQCCRTAAASRAVCGYYRLGVATAHLILALCTGQAEPPAAGRDSVPLRLRQLNDAYIHICAAAKGHCGL